GDDLDLVRLEFLLLLQNLFFHADFAHVMKHRGKAQFAQLSRCENDISQWSRVCPVNGFGESNSIVGYAHTVAGCHRIAGFDCRYAGIDKSFEEAFLLLEQEAVFDSQRRLPRNNRKEPLVLFVEVRKWRRVLRIERRAVLRKFIQELHHADEISTRRNQRARKYVSRRIVQDPVHRRKDLAGPRGPIEENRFSVNCGSAGEARIVDLELKAAQVCRDAPELDASRDHGLKRENLVAFCVLSDSEDGSCVALYEIQERTQGSI